jgi:hypothetical protein
MKGISLPINAIVIVAIAVLVLVVVAAFFSGMLIPSSLEIQRESALNKACNTWRLSYNCHTDQYDEPLVSYTDPAYPDDDSFSVQTLCELTGITTEEACRVKCNCPEVEG